MSTWRHTFYGQCLILLIAGCAYGQWDTNAWPAYEHPRAGKVQAENCVSSVVERVNVVVDGTTMYPSVSFWRNQRGNCIAIKDKIVSLASSAYHWSLFTNAADYAAFLNAHTNYPDASELVNEATITNKQQLCVMATVPTNFFDYTPYRGLDGVGPFTNDATVGHPHGWTNAYTVAGGTNFPYGRTNWYTTDYGWDGVKAVVIALKNRVVTQTGAAWNDNTGLHAAIEDSTNSFAEAKAFAEGSLTNGNGGTYWRASVTFTDPYFYQYKISMPIYNYGYVWKTNGAEPTISCAFLTYTMPTTNSVYGYDGAQLGYTNSGDWEKTNIIQKAYGWQLAETTNTSTTVKTAYIGTTNFIPDSPSYPSGSGNSISRGVGLRSQNLFIDYMTSIMFLDYTDGFKYK